MTCLSATIDASICTTTDQLKSCLTSSADAIEIYVMQDAKGELIVTPKNRNEETMSLVQVFQCAREYPKKNIHCFLKVPELEFKILKLAKQVILPNQLIYSGMVDLELIKKDRNQLPDVQIYLDIEQLFPAIYQVAHSIEFEEYFYDFVYYSLMQSKKYEVACVNINHSLCADNILNYMQRKEINCSIYMGNENYLDEKLLTYTIYNITRNAMSLS